MKYYLIAGEASGDLHGANLMKAILEKDSNAEFRFWGGDKMAQINNATQVEHYKNTAFMGFVEVIKHLPKILGFIKTCKQDILNYAPDVVIMIDYPGFNMRVAQFAKENGFKTVYYISPQVWAWKENRVKKIKQSIDKMLVILPFEKDFYQKWNYAVDFVGHPLLDEISQHEYSLSLQTEKPIIAVLPGSRKQEISTILPLFLTAEKHFPEYQFVVAGLNHIEDDFYNKMLRSYNAKFVKNETYALLQNSKAALVASGTATLETAIFDVPMLVGYKGNFLSYHIGKYLVKIKFIALVNLIIDKKVVEELIQHELNEQNLKKHLGLLLEEKHRTQMQEAFKILKQKLGNEGASKNAAEIIVNYTNK